MTNFLLIGPNYFTAKLPPLAHLPICEPGGTNVPQIIIYSPCSPAANRNTNTVPNINIASTEKDAQVNIHFFFPI